MVGVIPACIMMIMQFTITALSHAQQQQERIVRTESPVLPVLQASTVLAGCWLLLRHVHSVHTALLPVPQACPCALHAALGSVHCRDHLPQTSVIRVALEFTV